MGTAARPLSRKILSLALLNLILIAAILAAFAQWQFGLSVESLVLGPARDRILAIANAVGRDLDSTPYTGRAELLDTYSRRYGVEFSLIDPRGNSLAGPNVELPPLVLERLGASRPEGGRKGPPPHGPPPDGLAANGFDPSRGPPLPPGGGPPGTGPERMFLTVTRGPLIYWVGIRIPTNGPQGERGVPAVLLLRAASLFNSRLFFDWRSLLLLAGALALVALVCWWPFVHGVTQSIRQMDRATEEIAQGRFDRHGIQKRRDELGHLGEQINRMAVRLEGLVKHQKRFLGDIAHELCSPIARIQFALGILEQKVEVPQQTHVAVLRGEIQEMSELVNELLVFSKAGMQAPETALKPVDLAAIVQRAVSQQLPGSGTMQVMIPPALAALANESYLLRAVSNLLRNALRYAGDDGPITVQARREDGRVLLTVTDCGPGLPEQALEDVFTPFYRVEAARTRETGGVGLGLAIVKSCVEACGGSVTCRNRTTSGLEVTISLASCGAASDRSAGG